MSLKPPTDIVVVKKEDKEAKLSNFLTATLAGQPADRDLEIAVFARSVESPVVQALAKLVAGRRHARLAIRLVVTALEIEDFETASATPALAASSASVRIAADPRLLEAHEQMVLGPRTTWIGDCLRREPMKRDAYERFTPDGEDTARGAMTAFERLWAHAVAIAMPQAGANCELELPAVAMDAAGAEGDLNGATAATRH